MTWWRNRETLRDLAVSLVASALWVPLSSAFGSRFGRPVLLAGTGLVVFAGSFVALRVTAGERRMRRTMADFCSEPSASKAGDVAVDLLEQLMARGRLGREAMAQVAQRRRHPVSRILDGIDVLVDRHGPVVSPEGRSGVAIADYLRSVRAAKVVTRTRAARQAAQQLTRLLGPDSLLLLYGYSSVVCEAVSLVAPSGPVFVVRDAQYGIRSSLGEHQLVQGRLRSNGIDSFLIDSDQITALLDPSTSRLRPAVGASLPLPAPRDVVAVIGCEAADRSGRVFIPATVRSQPSETAWFVAEFARARQRGQGAAIGAQLVVLGESYKVFDDLRSRPELRTTSAPVALPWRRRVAHVIGVSDLPLGARFVLVYSGPDHVDMYVDDVLAVRTRGGTLRLDGSYDVWNERVGIAQAPTGVSARELMDLVGQCDLVFIDFNGVLVDDEVDHYCAFAALARTTTDRSLPIDVYLTACAGRTDREGVEELTRLGFTTGPIDALLSQKQALYQDHATPVGTLQRGRIEQVLDGLGRAGPVVLVTASDRPSVVAALGDARLVQERFPPDRALFDVASGDRVAAIEAVARAHGMAENRRCLVVDDSARNLAELRRRGYRTVGVSGLISARALPADVVVRDLAELADLLDQDRSRG